MGALPSVVPFACTDVPQTAFVAAAVLCSLASFFVGAFITTATKGNPWTTGGLNAARALVGGGIAWAITEGYKLGS
jgi:VIT1/CCC1 family predicted Fe2+/Mn2+ transporter